MVVLDVSGSMRRTDGAGRTLLEGARGALAELVGSLPRDAGVGLRVYGSEYAGRDRRRSCQDTRLLLPVSRVDPGRVRGAVEPLRPTGDTPIGLALRRAAGDLGELKASRRVVVLISDGEDNCSPPAPPPCEVAKTLRQSGVRLRVETVGVALEGKPKARRALQCISDNTGGDYYDARGADALSAALERISSHALGGLGPGKQVRGGRHFVRAPLLEPGSYRTALRPGEEKWFRVRVREHQMPRLLATVRGVRSLRLPREARRCPAWRAELYNPYGEGGTYPPYGNSGVFSGVGLGTTGASSARPVEEFPTGIDYAGIWRVRLALGTGGSETCSQYLPEDHRFPVRFSLSLSGPAQEEGEPGATVPEESASPSGSPSPTSAPEAEDEEAPVAAKYETPVRESTPAWLYPVVAVVAVVLLGLTVVGLRVMLRRRRQGW
jgi:hypothetical protein